MNSTATKPKYVAPVHRSRFDKQRVQRYGAELAKLERKHGGVTPALLVDEARNSRSLFHREFEWDDTQAAEQFRRVQAAKLIQWIKVEVHLVGPKKGRRLDVAPVIQRGFHSVRVNGDRKYVSITTVQEHEEYCEQLLKECLDEAARWAKKAKMFEVLHDCVVVVEQTVKKLRKAGFEVEAVNNRTKLNRAEKS